MDVLFHIACARARGLWSVARGVCSLLTSAWHTRLRQRAARDGVHADPRRAGRTVLANHDEPRLQLRVLRTFLLLLAQLLLEQHALALQPRLLRGAGTLLGMQRNLSKKSPKE